MVETRSKEVMGSVIGKILFSTSASVGSETHSCLKECKKIGWGLFALRRFLSDLISSATEPLSAIPALSPLSSQDELAVAV